MSKIEMYELYQKGELTKDMLEKYTKQEIQIRR